MEADGSIVGGRRREGNLGGSIETLDSNNSVSLAVEVHHLEESVNLLAGVGRPDSDVISCGVRKVRARDINLHVQAVAGLVVEQLLGLGDGCDVRVVCIVWTLGSALKVVLVRLAKVDSIIVGIQLRLLGDLEDRLVHRLALFQVHCVGKGSPHGLLPGQKVLFHGTSTVVALTGLTDTLRSQTVKELDEVADHGVVVFISVVSKTECDVTQVFKSLLLSAALLAERDLLAADELVEFHSVVRGLALAIGGHDEDGDLVLGELVQVLVVVVFQIGGHGLQAEARGALLCQAGGVVFSGSGLRAIEDNAVLSSLVHFLDDVAALARLG